MPAAPNAADSRMQKVPPITLRKMANNGRIIAIAKSTSPATKASPATANGTNVAQQHAGGPSGYIAVRQNLTIDLTDEEEPKSVIKTYVNNNNTIPPALSSVTNRGVQYTVTHQRLLQQKQIGKKSHIHSGKN